VANGAKHFKVSDKRHRSVANAERRGGYFPGRYFAKRFFAGRYFAGGALVLELDGDAAGALGSSISVVGLAEKVLYFWKARISG
jgi:hypothetical protein